MYTLADLPVRLGLIGQLHRAERHGQIAHFVGRGRQGHLASRRGGNVLRAMRALYPHLRRVCFPYDALSGAHQVVLHWSSVILDTCTLPMLLLLLLLLLPLLSWWSLVCERLAHSQDGRCHGTVRLARLFHPLPFWVNLSNRAAAAARFPGTMDFIG